MNKVPQNEAHLHDSIMEYIFERIDREINAPCHQWIGPTSTSLKLPSPRAKKFVNGHRNSFMPHIVIYNYHNYPNKKSPIDWNKGKGQEIRRKCNNLMCVNIDCLVLGDRSKTIQATINRGKTAIGNDYGVKYDADIIRADHQAGLSYRDIMKKYNIPSKGTISYIINKAKR